jgi:hypothetical protein
MTLMIMTIDDDFGLVVKMGADFLTLDYGVDGCRWRQMAEVEAYHEVRHNSGSGGIPWLGLGTLEITDRTESGS